MKIKMHKSAMITPRGWALRQTRDEPIAARAARFSVGLETIARWEHRHTVGGLGAHCAPSAYYLAHGVHAPPDAAHAATDQ